MLQLKEKELPFLESFTGDKYTSPFFLFSRIDTRPIVQKPFNIIFDLRAKQALWKKSAYGENFASYQRIGARWYDPEIGLWTTPDPIPEFHNPYSYTGGDPVNFTDPAGLATYNLGEIKIIGERPKGDVYNLPEQHIKGKGPTASTPYSQLAVGMPAGHSSKSRIEQQIQEQQQQQEEGKTEIIEESKEEDSGLIPPVPSHFVITSPYGMRTHPKTGKKKLHPAIDLASKKGRAATTGKPVKAIKSGIAKVSRSTYGGNTVEIDHGDGTSTKYLHLKNVIVKNGAKVKAGETIGTVGSSGRVTGPHLHFEMHKGGTPFDPAPFFQYQKR